MRESKRSGGLVDSLYCIIWVVYPKCIRQHIDVCSFSLFKQVSEGETNWAQAQPDLLNSLPQAVRTAGSICIADGLSRTSCANPQTISVLIQPWRIKASWKSTRYVWSWCTKGSYIVKPLNFSGPSYMCKESDVFPKPQGKVTGIPAGDSRGASTSSSWAFGGDNRRKTTNLYSISSRLGISILLLVSFLDLPQDSFSCRSDYSYLLLELDATVCVLVLPREGAVLGGVSMSFDSKHAIWGLFWCIFLKKLLYIAAHASGCTAAEVVGDLHRSPLQVWLCVGLSWVSSSLGNLGWKQKIDRNYNK